MAIFAKLQFGDNDSGYYSNEYPVVACECHITRHYNSVCPDSDAKCDRMMVVVVAPGKENRELLQWYISQSCMSGRILFDNPASPSDDWGQTREIRFEDARCFLMEETYDVNSNRRRQMKLEFMADEVTVDTTTYKLG